MQLDREGEPVRLVRKEQMLESADTDDFASIRFSDIPLHPIPRAPEAGVFVLGSVKEEWVSRVQGVRFIPEGFADRRYRPDGSLVPRTESGAFVESPE